jgi:indolepyruvate ferredoxin oxidoreductase, alpha subunit
MTFASKLLSKTPFTEIVMGNHALVRGFIEANTRVVTAYPGSPTPEISDAIKTMSVDNRPFYFEFSTNEKVATEVAFGASINGHLSTVFFKSVGLNVAADSFVQLSHMKLTGGMVIVIGDDPGANSSQNEQDNRHLAQLSYTPVLEPATPQEVYEMYLKAAALTKKLQMPVILRLTTHVCHARSMVSFENWTPDNSPREPLFDSSSYNYLPITKLVYPMKRRALENLELTREIAETISVNHIVDNKNPKRGVITMGVPFLSLMDVCEKSNSKPDILKLGMVYPLPNKKILDFLNSHEEVKVLEELDDLLEKEVKSIAWNGKVKTIIHGKGDVEDWMGEYTPGKVYEVMEKVWPDMLPKRAKKIVPSVEAPGRPPQLCPGCGHRSAFYAIKKALDPTDITVADIGCHTLGFLPPYKMGEVLLCMGASPGIGSGLALFNTSRKVVAFMGDSTFYHAGSAGVINAMFNNHNLTLIIMENGTTAMTGHQNHPGTGENYDELSQRIPISSIMKSYGVKVREVDTYQQAKLTAHVNDAINEEGFNVIIAKHPCMLKNTRERKRKGTYKSVQVQISDKCDNQYVCIGDFGCPTFTVNEKGAVSVNKDLCIGDGSCLQTCPSTAIEYPTKGGVK